MGVGREIVPHASPRRSRTGSRLKLLFRGNWGILGTFGGPAGPGNCNSSRPTHKAQSTWPTGVCQHVPPEPFVRLSSIWIPQLRPGCLWWWHWSSRRVRRTAIAGATAGQTERFAAASFDQNLFLPSAPCQARGPDASAPRNMGRSRGQVSN